MTCRFNILIFMIFIGILGLNYYIGNDNLESETNIDYPLKSQRNSDYSSNAKSTKDMALGISSQALVKKGNLINRKADTLTINLEKILSAN